ncbi:uncharacterized protein L969DRAFT_92920 [Mixia osmundae IAM 14324]|uniref:Acyltransferase MbtK/IucB-like conserved domain-containing protein n=1 Tax=Mixia osmundae (strain CBS 9802 / IAM 14324 / JCM 22182 / KY 12970) TaxID=764103 RepID=G7DTS0_MIXOS|nr:uncharacterized protein L969DRAFT_92920 [Mixia osmundae IAM 14324]KEI41696.1 hypothetical protein L969DRAFT_92920 [Mixia osmundae IAM 14324]GAA93980.1 hypothetical protein E5Q_00627 [Mixia osmundae IAM 14324]
MPTISVGDGLDVNYDKEQRVCSCNGMQLILQSAHASATLKEADKHDIWQSQRTSWALAYTAAFYLASETGASFDIDSSSQDASVRQRASSLTQSRITRSYVMQLFALHLSAPQQPFPNIASHTESKRGTIAHPLRPPQPLGCVYSRYIPHLDEYFQLEPYDHARLDLMHGWLNDPRVDQYWQDKGTLEDHKKYLGAKIDDLHNVPVIGSYRSDRSGVSPACYFDIYWAKEDRIGEFYDAGDYDRGIHMLVGSKDHRGPHRVRAWLVSLCHYIFIDDPRTMRIVSEPDARNTKMIDYLIKHGFRKEKEFDFPHKRAALMILDRTDYFVNDRW